jgi:hypothetical protein
MNPVSTLSVPLICDFSIASAKNGGNRIFRGMSALDESSPARAALRGFDG